MKTLKLAAILACGMLYACQGEKGDKGDSGPQGNANVDAYQFTLDLAAYHHYGSSDVYGEPAPAFVTNLASDQMALVYLWMDPVDGSYEWVQQPFVHYFNSGNSFNHFFHGVESDGDLWLYIRNSAGLAPYSPMSGQLKYKVFVIADKMRLEMDQERVDKESHDDVVAFFYRHDYRVVDR